MTLDFDLANRFQESDGWMDDDAIYSPDTPNEIKKPPKINQK